MVYLRSAVLLFSGIVLQLGFFADMRIGGVAAQCLLALSVAAGLTGGYERGAIFGFAAGLLIDVFLPTPFGLSAFAYAIAGGLMGLAQDAVMERSIMTLVGFPALGSGIGIVAFVLGGVALGQSYLYNDQTGRILVTVVLLNAMLGVILVPLTGWMWDQDWDRGRISRRL